MPSVDDVLAYARFVVIALAAVAASVVATVLHRRMEASQPPAFARERRAGGPPRARGPALPKLFFSVMLSDWFFGCIGAISLSMDLVMGFEAKMRNVMGVTVEGVFQATLLATILWGPILSAFVLVSDRAAPPPASAAEAQGGTKRQRQPRPFRVRTSWAAAWTLASAYGLLMSTKIQAYVFDWPGKRAVRTVCLVYLSAVYGISLLLALATLGVLLRRRRRLWGRHQAAPIRFSFTTNSTSEPTPMLARSLADSRVKEEQVAEARRYELHMKIMQYVLLVLLMQLPYMLYHWLGYEVLSSEFAGVADCLLFAMPLVNTIVFSRWTDMGTGRRARATRDRDDDASSTMLQSTEGPGGNSARVNANGSMGIFGLSARPGGPGVFGHSSRVGGAFASSYRSFFGSSHGTAANASAVREKDTAALKGTFIGTGTDQVTLDEIDGLTNVSFIAEGASGSVYKAQWLGIEVAMKIIKLPTTEGDGTVDADLYRTFIQSSEMSFIEEAALCARLRHPNITLFIRAGFYEGKLGILTEYCSRGSLKSVLKRYFPLGWRRKVALALHISKGLTYLHARNPTYIHRDLKASNILVTDTWQAKLADFGISKVANIVSRVPFNERVTLQAPPSSGSAAQNPSRAGSMIDELTSFAGTWRWNAPEVLMDPHNCRYNRATDMYSFGMVLWEIASDGAVPFSDTRFDFEVREKVLVEQRPPINPAQRCPDKFADLIRQCWSQSPALRPSAPQAAEVLTAILETMESDAYEFATGASISASDYTNSIFSSLRGTTSEDARPSVGARLTNLLRGRFSNRSSSKSSGSTDEAFQKFASPAYGADARVSLRDHHSVDEQSASVDSLDGAGFGASALSRSSAATNNSRRFMRLSSLSEYELGAGQPSDMSAGFSVISAGEDDAVPSFRDMRIDAMLEESPDDSNLDHDEVLDVDPDEEMFMDINGRFHRLSQVKRAAAAASTTSTAAAATSAAC